MNSLKNLLFLGILAAAAVGVYISLNHNSDPTLPPEAAQNAANISASPKVELPTSGMAPAPSGASPAGVTPSPGLPAAPGSGGQPPPGFGVPSLAPPADASAGSGAAPGPPAPPPLAQGAESPVPPPPVAKNDPEASRRVGLAVPSDAFASGRASSAPRGGSRLNLDSVMQAVEAKMDAGHLADALVTLTSLYNHPEVPPEQARQITRLLDQMAATVIYSRQHLIEPAYKVQPGDTLDRIADMYSVPSQLLARINGIRDPQNLPPNRDIKVLHGPFDALVDPGKLEMTLMLKGRYAGRFPIGIGADRSKLEGTYLVRDKRALPAGDASGGVASAQTPAGPSPRYWIDLGNQIGIQGTSDLGSVGRTGAGGPIWLGDRDMEDVFGILSIGSKVVIQR